jgi:hypothetical protein
MENQRFVLTEEHIKLLRGMYVGWNDCEFGAPEIDPKRPYGNSNPYPDMLVLLGHSLKVDAELMGEKIELDEDCYELPETVVSKLRKLHSETEIALQIVLSTGAFAPGIYEATYCCNDWKRVA